MAKKNREEVAAVETSALKIYLRLLSYIKPYRLLFVVSILGFALYALSTTLFLKILENLIAIIDANNPADRFLVPLHDIARLGCVRGCLFSVTGCIQRYP
jgi:subfamily B ATP-binding cassette protein MsbA